MGMAAPTNPDELLALEGQMRAPDAIMEPGMAEVVGKYIRAGGKPEEVIESLTTSYEGCAQMASLVCHWIKLVDAPYAPPGAVGMGNSSSGAFDAAPAASAPSVGGSVSSATHSELIPDEFTLLQELTRERFDSDQLLSVFRRGRPLWLHELAGDARGRRLILDLSAEHHSSIFLNYAIRRIFDTGHDDEVAAVGSSLSSYFEVYHRLLVKRLTAAATAGSTAQLERASAELADACAASQHTYTHAQHLVCHMASLGGQAGTVFRRLSQDLEAAAAERHGGTKVWAMQPLFVPRDASPQQREAVRLVSRALVLGAGGSGIGGACITQVSQLLSQLQELYSKRDDHPPTMEPLQHPRFLQMLLEGVFSWQQAPAAAVQRTASHLLALAALEAHLMDSSDSSDYGTSALTAQAHLETARALAGRAASGEKLGEAELGEAQRAAEVLTLAGLGLLHLAKGVLSSAAVYDDDRCTAAVPSLLSLLQVVVAAQPARVPEVVVALQGALSAMGARRPELADRVGTLLVELLLAGHVAEVLSAAEAWAVGGADPSLIRAFALRVLERAAPPYSQEFARPLLRLMHAGKMGVAKKAGMLVIGGAVERLREFAAECLDGVEFAPVFSDPEIELLERLAS